MSGVCNTAFSVAHFDRVEVLEITSIMLPGISSELTLQAWRDRDVAASFALRGIVPGTDNRAADPPNGASAVPAWQALHSIARIYSRL